jgi:putative adhesin
MRTFINAVALATVVVLGLAPRVLAQNDFHWSGQLSPGQTLEIKGINGSIRADGAAGGFGEVTATKTAQRSNPNDVRIEAVPHAGGVTICAIYPSEAGRPLNTCEPGNGGNSSTRNNDVVVSFVVHVPSGVALAARTVNGDIDGESLTGDADAKTVNGSVKLSTTGTATANTVNGSITATMGRADWQQGASFKTVNGGIMLKFGGDLNANVKASTLNGSITTDFPLTLTGTFTRRRLEGTIGAGGRSLDLSTVNGSITLARNE